MGKKVNAVTLKYVETVGCAQECDKIIPINKGIPLPCKEWTNEESTLLRERMLTDNQLFNSGFVRRVEGSTLGNSRRIRKSGLDVGPIKTQSNGAAAVNECKVSFEGVRVDEFEKTFYIVNTEKNIQICTKQYVGTKWQDLVGGQMSNYSADEFEDSDLADIIIAKIIERFNEFVPVFMLMATCDNPGENMHGDDGVLAKAYYAGKNQYYHTLQFDLSEVETDFPNVYINGIVGGSKYDKDPNDFATPEQYILDFVEWINTRKEGREYMHNASIDLGNDLLYVASNFVTRVLDLRIVLNDGSLVDWGCKSTFAAELAPTELQRPMLINDTPLLFQYENIDESNFAQKFKNYKKEFKRYIHRNGFGDEFTEADILIGIDPELMLEREAQTQNAFIGGNFNPTFMDEIGLTQSQFRPLNALNNTGLFFMTVRENLLLLDDASNSDNTMLNMGQIRIAEACDTPGLVNIFGGTPPLGSEVEHWGLFASNLTDSYFVIDNKLDSREPCENAKLNLVCFDDNVKNECLVEATCTLVCSVDSVAVYDADDDETNITATVTNNTPSGTTLVYALDWALSDGTAGTASTASFVITVPGDQTDNGLRLSVTGSIEAQIASETQCSANVNYSTEFGSGTGFGFCIASDTNENAGNPITTQLSVQYQIDGESFDIALQDNGLDYSQTGDFQGIEDELEAIFPGTTVVLTDLSGNTQTVISNLPSFITNITITSATTTNATDEFVIDCE